MSPTMPRSRPRYFVGALAVASTLVFGALVPAAGATAAGSPTDTVTVVVRKDAGSRRAAETAVRRAGGTVDARIRLIRGFVATVPAGAELGIERAPGVASVVLNTSLALSGGVDGTDPAGDLGSMVTVRETIGADAYWSAGFTGQGIDVAVIDSGVAPVEGLTTAGKVVNGPDLSFESQDPDLRYLDTFGHGTHMAGIIAGRDSGTYALDPDDDQRFLGIAPDARIVSVKVADAFGTTDLVQVLVALDWVVKNRTGGPMDLNIKVLNLSFGTDSTQAYIIDPLAFAVEMAWRKGIFVVAAAGNEGYGTADMNSPAYDPFVLAVGSSDPNGTFTRHDDVVADFSTRGTVLRHPDVVAPGRSIVSLRDPGSFIDRKYPAGRVGDTPRFFRGSGTSQATAVVSGAAALILDQRPGIKPDELKRLLMASAFELPQGDEIGQGEGLLDLVAAIDRPTMMWKQVWPRGTGLGSIQKARGSQKLSQGGVRLKGSRDIFGNTIDVADWAANARLGASWTGGKWMGRSWTGKGWSTESWSGRSWTGRSWTRGTWTGRSWTSEA